MKRSRIQLVNILLSLTFIMLLSCGENEEINSDFTPTTEFSLKVEGFESYNIEGFHVLVDEAVFEIGVSALDEFLYFLRDDLVIILNLDLKEEIKTFFKTVPIFVQKENTRTAAYYGIPVDVWVPNSDGAITIVNLYNYQTYAQQNQPFIMLHELSHSYHDQVLTFINAEIQEAYDRANENGLYTNVWYDPGDGNLFKQDFAYALTNQVEFFAEVTEAYFGKNDFYPFNRSQLQQYDPFTYSVIEKAWEKD